MICAILNISMGLKFLNQSTTGIYIFQRKNALDILKESSVLDCRFVHTWKNRNSNILQNEELYGLER